MKFGKLGLIFCLLAAVCLSGMAAGCSSETAAPVTTTVTNTATLTATDTVTATATLIREATPVVTGQLNISVAASLTDVIKEINDLYTQRQPGVTITANFASSGTLQKQIENGAPVDVFISAAQTQMNNLQDQQLILNDTRQNLLNNKIVLIVPQDSALNISSFDDLTDAGVTKIAIGEPKSVPAGAYAVEVMDKLGITTQLQDKFVYGADVRQVLTYVENGDVDAGVVYMTDALTSSRVKVAANAPAEFDAKVTYPIAVIKAVSNLYAALDYEDFLFSDEAGAIFKKYGFTLVSG